MNNTECSKIRGVSVVRENWDFVTFKNYSADMAEATQRSMAIIAGLRKRAEMAERLLAEVVLASGGSVKVREEHLHDPRRMVDLTTWINQADRTIEFTAKRLVTTR